VLIAELEEVVESGKYVEVLNIKLPLLLPMQVLTDKKARLGQMHMWLEFRMSPVLVGDTSRRLAEYGELPFPRAKPAQSGECSRCIEDAHRLRNTTCLP
jgi:hypothetical protein